MKKILDTAPERVFEPVPDQDVRVRSLALRLDAETRAALSADYVAGLTTIQLMAKYQLSKSSVLKLLAEAGVETRRRTLSPDQVAQVVERYEAGLAIREVAAELRLPKTTVQDALRNAGVEMRAAARRPKSR